MTTPLACLLIVAVMPYVLAPIGGWLRIRQLGSLDNHHPRTQALKLEGIAARALAAQANAWEATTVFGAVVLVNHLAQANPAASATAAQVYVATRLAHAALYLADLPTARTLVFVVGLAALGRMAALATAAG